MNSGWPNGSMTHELRTICNLWAGNDLLRSSMVSRVRKGSATGNWKDFIWDSSKKHHWRKWSMQGARKVKVPTHPSRVSEQYCRMRRVHWHVHRPGRDEIEEADGHHDQDQDYHCVSPSSGSLLTWCPDLWGVLKLLVRFRASGSNEPRPPDHHHHHHHHRHDIS